MAFSAQVFVSPTGNDANNGLSVGSPKRTLAAALTAASAGQTISAADGTYSGNFITTKGGTAGSFITIRAANRWGATVAGNGSTSGQSAVEINHQYLRIQDFSVTGPGGSGTGARHGFTVNANNVEIIGNHIHTICQWLTGGTSWQGGAGIGCSGTKSNVLIDGNNIHDIGLRSSTQQLVHGMYIDAHVTGSRVQNNAIWECEDFGLHPYDAPESSGWQFYNNTVTRCGRGILTTGTNYTLRNNLCYNNGSSNYDIRSTGDTLSNNFSGGTGNVTGTGITGGVNPLFVNGTDSTNPDLRLQSSSPCIDAGTATGAPSTDFDGKTRPQGAGVDVGAFEYGATATASFPYAGYPDGVAYPTIPVGTSVVNVSTSAALTTALANAVAGQRIVLANGTYTGAFTISKTGTSTAGISIEAGTTGGAVFASGSTFIVNNSAYVTLKGLSFPYELSSGNIVAFRGTSNRCRVTRCLFGPSSLGTAGSTKATCVYGGDDVNHIRVDHCEIRFKTNPGNAILFDGNFTTFQTNQHIRIDHNYIHDVRPEISNEKEPVRLGVSTMSKTFAYSVVERNVFIGCIAEPEIVSVKACGVRVSGNTFLRSIGGPVYRHGTNGVMSDNYVIDRVSTFGTTIGSGGFRVYDKDHEVSYNYIDGVRGGPFQGPLLLDTGDAEGTSTNLAGHWRVVNAKVERNVIVGGPEGIRIGDNYSLAPTGCTIRDNVVAQVASGAAVTQLVAPASSTLSNNTYSATPGAAGLAQDGDAIWRKVDYGPRLTYLQAADVGVAGDAADADGTGTLISVSGGPAPDATTAAGAFGWGTPLPASDEFGYSGAPTSAKWSMYDGPGHSGNGLRVPGRATVDGAKLVGTGLNNGDSFGMAHRFDQQYGRWEVRMRCFETGTVVPGARYHVVFIIWPDSDQWPEDGEYDFVELSIPGQATLGAFMHFPHDASASVQQREFNLGGVDTGQFHNYGFEWTPNDLVGFVDGVEWFRTGGGASSIRRDIQTMPSGHLTIQLDNFDGTNQTPATMEVEWARVYSLTPSAPPTSPQTVSPLGIPSAQQLGFPVLTGAETAPPPGSGPTLLGTATAILGTAHLGYTTVGPPPPPDPASAQTVSGAGGIGSAQAVGVPVLSVADGPKTLDAIGIASAERFGTPSLSGVAPPTPAPGGVLVPALFAVGADTSTLTPLPNWSKISVSPVRNSPGAITVDYPAGTDGFDALDAGVSASPLHALEVRIWLGGNATGALGGWLVSKSGDDLTPGSTWTFSGHFQEWLLKKAIVAPQLKSTGNENGELRFAGATAGLILGTVMDQAKARGALPYVARDFTSTTDSNGVAWVNYISSFNLAPMTTTQQVADKLVELGMVEYELTAFRLWRAYNPGTHGTDTTATANPLTFQQATNLAEHSRRESVEDAATSVLAAGSEGFYDWGDSVTGAAELGWRAEVGYSAGQVSSEAGVAAAADIQMEIARRGIAEYDAAIEFVLGNPLPLIDYGIGDWAWVTAGDTRRKLRIAQLGLTFQPGRAPSGTVALNDLITDKLSALYRRLNSIQTGDAVVGTSTSTPGGTGEDINPPAAPIGVVASSTIAYRVPAEDTVLALVAVGWSAVTTNAYPDTTTAGKALISGYIADRIRSGQAIAEDWTWTGMPPAVVTYHDALSLEWQAAPTFVAGAGGTVNPAALAWLTAYPAAHLGGGTITDDIAHYRVQYSYIGGTVVGQYSPTPDWVIPRDPNDPTGFGVDYSWGEPDESPTSGLTLTFGGVTAERPVGVRVAAVDNAGNQGPWSGVVGLVTAADDTPPPVPSKPTVNTYLRTIDITWDGKGASGEDMRLAAPDLDGVEVHLGTGILFTPDRPVGAGGKVDLSTSSTYQQTLYTAGTWNVTDLTIGITYFARLVAVDRAGNASPPSVTSDGALPELLVNIEIGPNAIARQQIIDGEIVNAKIANLAVNDAKISDLQVGKITAGTLVANVILGGRFSTPISNGNHIEIDAGGIRLYQGSSVVGRWQVFDASMMMTGQFNTAVTGQRIVMNPGGANPDTIRFYPTFSDVYSSIDAVSYGGGMLAGIRIVGSANPTTNQRGMLVIRDQYASLVHGRQDLTYFGSEMWVEEHFTRNKSAVVDLILDERLTSIAGPRRVAMICYDVNGNPINESGLYYQRSAYFGGEPHFYGNGMDVGLIFSPGVIKVMNNPNVDFRTIMAAAFVVGSGRELKRDIRDLDDLDEDLLKAVKRVKPKRYRRRDDPDDAPERVGLVADDLPYPVRVTDISVPTNPRRSDEVTEAIDLSAALAVLWGGVQKIDKRLDALERERNP